MRLKKEITEFIRQYSEENFFNAKVYLFGSRTDDNKKGGDIDILILTDEKLRFSDLSKMRINFRKLFGEQKIDLVNFTYTETDPFKDIALHQAIEL
ncbi:MAG: nucleotidyltransferase domain-containing protein [Ignavibacteria bacterium]